jgi:hypothetical protein
MMAQVSLVNTKFLSFLALVVVMSATGCQSPSQPGSRTAVPATITVNSKADIAVRNNALALLQDLLNDEQDVSKVLYLKSASDETSRLLKDISAAAKEYHTKIQAFAEQLPDYDFKKLDLPPGEVAARKAESKTQEHAILHSHGADFEFNILLSQAQALDYGTHLARVIATNETDSTQAGQFSAFAEELNALFERTTLALKTIK